jgi:hypothetical protein
MFRDSCFLLHRCAARLTAYELYLLPYAQACISHLVKDCVVPNTKSRNNVNKVSGLHDGLHDRAIGVRSPAEGKDCSSSLFVQTGSEAHPVSCPVGIGDPFPAGKARPGRDADRSLPSSAKVENE